MHFSCPLECYVFRLPHSLVWFSWEEKSSVWSRVHTSAVPLRVEEGDENGTRYLEVQLDHPVTVDIRTVICSFKVGGWTKADDDHALLKQKQKKNCYEIQSSENRMV
jgi:hypothetical protein